MRDEGPRFLRTGPALDVDAQKAERRGKSHSHGDGRSDRSRALERQVTTATPARLDFRATEAAGEGCADTMSTKALAVLRPPMQVSRPESRLPSASAGRFGLLSRVGGWTGDVSKVPAHPYEREAIDGNVV